ncbi:hypothetical protein QBC47DRAFT_393325 [Echria macrotheca]|uniref:DUF2423 domain-containing protein n=1 Tax=Echria macrotheca TaxID=438768 RepID=A0AAJ0B7C8_9PEZI|nr:hypothetical protein QBC47DRAFT_393325 [Echria macrotheca]
MAKSARSSQIKTNNQRLKKNVFGPVETARAERLSAKLLELARQPKPAKEVEMATAEDAEDEAKDGAAETVMDVDSGAKPVTTTKVGKTRIEKRRSKKSSIVFPKYGEKKVLRKRK